MSDLLEAVSEGDVALVHRILQSDPSCVHDRNEYCETALHVVCKAIDVDDAAEMVVDITLPIMQILIEYGADVNARDEVNDQTPLFKAVMIEQVEGVKLLLEHGADQNLRDNFNQTALHSAVNNGNEKIIELLLRYGADINAFDCNGCTPLDYVIDGDKFDKARFLIKAGAKARRTLKSLLNCGYEHEDENRIKFLIQHAAEIDLEGRFSIEVLYISWRISHDIEFLKQLLLDEGVDVKGLQCTDEKMTELHIVADGKKDIARLKTLLKAGADVNAKDILGHTPLHLLFLYDKSGDLDQLYIMAKLLIEAGADLYVQDFTSDTPFQNAVYQRYSKIVNLMLAKITGVAESTLKNKWNYEMWPYKFGDIMSTVNPLAVAVLLGYEEVVDRLIDMQHHMKATNPSYNTPLYCVVRGRHYGVARILFEAGYRVDERYPYGIPLLNLRRCNSSYLKLVCLLWEFDCTPIFRKSLVKAISFVEDKPNANKLIYLLIFYYAIGLSSNKFNQDLTSLKKVFYSNERLLSIFDLCNKQLGEFEKESICGSLSKLDLLIMKLDALVQFLNDENNFKACKGLYSSLNDNAKTEYYDYAIKVRIELAMEKRELLNSAKDYLNEALEDVLDLVGLKSLPDEIAYNIIGYLNTRELKKISKED